MRCLRPNSRSRRQGAEQNTLAPPAGAPSHRTLVYAGNRNSGTTCDNHSRRNNPTESDTSLLRAVTPSSRGYFPHLLQDVTFVSRIYSDHWVDVRAGRALCGAFDSRIAGVATQKRSPTNNTWVTNTDRIVTQPIPVAVGFVPRSTSSKTAAAAPAAAPAPSLAGAVSSCPSRLSSSRRGDMSRGLPLERSQPRR